jgi:hypothetical protein
MRTSLIGGTQLEYGTRITVNPLGVVAERPIHFYIHLLDK